MDLRGFAILMLAFAAALFGYGFLIYKKQDYSLIPRGEMAKVKNKKTYARQFGKVIMWISMPPAVAALAAFLRDLGVKTRPIGITLIGNMILFIYVGIRLFMPAEDENDG